MATNKPLPSGALAAGSSTSEERRTSTSLSGPRPTPDPSQSAPDTQRGASRAGAPPQAQRSVPQASHGSSQGSVPSRYGNVLKMLASEYTATTMMCMRLRPVFAESHSQITTTKRSIIGTLLGEWNKFKRRIIESDVFADIFLAVTAKQSQKIRFFRYRA